MAPQIDRSQGQNPFPLQNTSAFKKMGESRKRRETLRCVHSLESNCELKSLKITETFNPT